MNILVPHSWLLDFLETRATAKQIAEALSLYSASVESVEKAGRPTRNASQASTWAAGAHDYVYNIEVTTNRIDMASVYGIAREASAALPRLGFKAKLKTARVISHTEDVANWKQMSNNYLKVKITNPSLCPRFTTLLYSIEVKPSPKWIQERLKWSAMRPVNNIVDVANYVMLELGQPMHAFDWDKIKEITKLRNYLPGRQAGELEKTLILRESEKGERVKTLDGVERILLRGDIVIEDGAGRLIDLCGIMGGENTAIDRNTRTVLLFAQTYNPDRIRKTIQTTGLRTEAATRFEKGLDPESVIPALRRAHQLLKETANAELSGRLIDIYPKPYKPKKITLDLNLLGKYLGLPIPSKEIIEILTSLGFKIKNQLPVTSYQSPVTIPSWRKNDINIQEDLVEEIARIYGYHNLPSNLNIGQPIKPADSQFYWLNKVKDALKYWGFTEVYTSSLVSKDLLIETGFNPKRCLRLKNPLGKDSKYLRPSLIPGVLQVVKENKSRARERVKIFELSKVYLRNNPLKGTTLPRVVPLSSPVQEPLMLTAAMTATNFLKAKGAIEALFEELGIKNYKIEPEVDGSCPIIKLLHPYRRAQITLEPSNPRTLEPCGLIGQIDDLTIFDLDFETLLKHASTSKTYQPLPQYPPIIEDLTFVFPPKTYAGPVMEEIKNISKLISQVNLITSYKNTRTFRIYYQHPERTLADKEVKHIRKKAIEQVERKFQAKAKI